MKATLTVGLLLTLAACGRSGVADVTLDADAAQREATAAKTLADLAAADAAARGPAPVYAAPSRRPEPARVPEVESAADAMLPIDPAPAATANGE
ncbi:hypothetical protein [Sphingomonas sp.]|uniref:hypothetical protein n=1 Tax=Sphingomonas sp. TaxID=28214 RepID=UPI003B3A16E1